MKKVAFHNLGCKVNAYEMEIIQQKFEKAGYETVSFDTKADVYVVNTCSVTNIADRKSRQMLNRAKSMNKDAVVVATGCYVQTDTEGANKQDSVDIIVGNNRKNEIVDIVNQYFEENEKKSCVIDINKETEYEDSFLDKTNDHTRVYVKIQDGCNQFCSYCIIPYARGRIRSRSVESIINEITALSKAGYKEIVLTGIHLSSYGIDFHIEEGGPKSYNEAADNGEYTNCDLIGVINRVSEIEGIERIRLGSLEPRAITHDFLKAISANSKMCPHFHLSLQSGSDSVLERMNRHYSADLFFEKTELIRQYFEHPAITTDVIVGFPGESEEEFGVCRDFLNKVNFYEVHVFKYSRRHGTVADRMPLQLTDRVKNERSNLLINDGNERSRAFREYYIGKEIDVLLEEKTEYNGETYNIGFSKEYVKVAVRGDEELGNTIVHGTVVSMLNDEILIIM